jgi:hypothetical protein
MELLVSENEDKTASAVTSPPHQVNCGNPLQKNFSFVEFCQLHPAVVEDSKITT